MPRFKVIDTEEGVFPWGPNSGEPMMQLTVQVMDENPPPPPKIERFVLEGFDLDKAIKDLQVKYAVHGKAVGRTFEAY